MDGFYYQKQEDWDHVLYPRRSKKKALIRVLPVLLTCFFCAMLGMRDDGSIRFTFETLTSRTLSKPELISRVSKYPFTSVYDVSSKSIGNNNNPSRRKKKKKKKVPLFYWHVPRSGGTTLKHVMGTCLKKVQASRSSSDYCDMSSDELQLCPTRQMGTLVNADPSDHVGLQRCERIGLVKSGLADVIVSSRFLHTITLFSEVKGKVVTVLRDPIDRAMSTFYYLRNANWERHYRPEYRNMTLMEYTQLPDTSSNWMVRWLVGKNADPMLDKEDLELAKEILRKKVLVLLMEELEESIQRLVDYMGWQIRYADLEDARTCLHKAVRMDRLNSGGQRTHNKPPEDSPEYRALLDLNSLDLELYKYAKEELFPLQGEMLYQSSKTKKRRSSNYHSYILFPDKMTHTVTTMQEARPVDTAPAVLHLKHEVIQPMVHDELVVPEPVVYQDENGRKWTIEDPSARSEEERANERAKELQMKELSDEPVDMPTTIERVSETKEEVAKEMAAKVQEEQMLMANEMITNIEVEYPSDTSEAQIVNIPPSQGEGDTNTQEISVSIRDGDPLDSNEERVARKEPVRVEENSLRLNDEQLNRDIPTTIQGSDSPNPNDANIKKELEALMEIEEPSSKKKEGRRDKRMPPATQDDKFSPMEGKKKRNEMPETKQQKNSGGDPPTRPLQEIGKAAASKILSKFVKSKSLPEEDLY